MKKAKKQQQEKRSAQQLTTGQSRRQTQPETKLLLDCCWTKTKEATATKPNSQAYCRLVFSHSLSHSLPHSAAAITSAGLPLPPPFARSTRPCPVAVFALIVKFFIRNLYS